MHRAGAHWKTHAPHTDKRQCGWDVETYEYWMNELAKEQQRPTTIGKSGIAKVPSTIYWTPSNPVPELWWAPHVHSFRTLPSSGLPPPAHTGVTFTTLTLNIPVYLGGLLGRIRSLGARVVRFRLPAHRGGLALALDRVDGVLEGGGGDPLASGADLKSGSDDDDDDDDDDDGSGDGRREGEGGAGAGRGKATAYVNCTGLGARTLVPDAAVYPVRGVTVLVKGEASGVRVLEGKDAVGYVIPRKGSGTTVLGGTKESGKWEAEAEEEVTRGILERCRELAPELLTGRKKERGDGVGSGGEDDEEGDFEVLKVNVGRRPAREGGARVELDREIGKDRILVHCYGHAGAGFQNSVGSAREVIQILKDRLVAPEGTSSIDSKAKL
ncbi:MAG: hypothetical protein Q9165_000439 [Trypethelium subeluteriae]